MFKAATKKAFVSLGGDLILREKNRFPRVLFWHGVENNPDPVVEAESISIKNFTLQLNYLEKNFEIISVDEFYIRYSENRFNGKEVVLTFDDGYQNNLLTLAPLLKKRNLPFTVFISTSNISSGELFPTSILRLAIFGSQLESLKLQSLNKVFILKTRAEKNLCSTEVSDLLKKSQLDLVQTICSDIIGNFSVTEWAELLKKYSSVQPLTWEEVRELKDFGCTIGSHCLDHICCHSNQQNEEVARQIIRSKEIIENQTGEPCNYFAYPNGDFTDFAQNSVIKAGYKIGFSTRNERLDSNKQQYSSMPRVSVPFNFDTFKIIINLAPK